MPVDEKAPFKVEWRPFGPFVRMPVMNRQPTWQEFPEALLAHWVDYRVRGLLQNERSRIANDHGGVLEVVTLVQERILDELLRLTYLDDRTLTQILTHKGPWGAGNPLREDAEHVDRVVEEMIATNPAQRELLRQSIGASEKWMRPRIRRVRDRIRTAWDTGHHTWPKVSRRDLADRRRENRRPLE
jgi:hypothetical protein